jgi:hypothetical protein
MSKAEEVAMEYCCEKCVHNKLGCGMKLLSHGRDCIKCGNYIKGYQQAEKDLANAMEETIKEVCEWLYNHNDYICGNTNSIVMYDMGKLIKDLKNHLEDKK